MTKSGDGHNNEKITLLTNFDVQTFSLMVAAVATALATAMFMNWIAQKRQPGTAQWAVGFGLNAAGAVLLHFYDPTTSPISWAVVGGTLLFSCWCLSFLGLCRYLGAACLSWRWVAAGVGLHLLAMLWFTVVVPNQAYRVLVYLLANTVVVSFMGRLLWRETRHPVGPGIYYFTSGLCGFHALFNVVRIGGVLSGHVVFERNGPLPPALAASFIEGSMMSVLLATSFIIMISQRIRHQLEIMARTDELSGLGNRRHFMESIHREVERARRYQRPLGLVVLDIDLFKRINDAHGHPCGDAVIQKVSRILRESLRQQDIICRIGGEEFGILMPETAEAATFASAERLRALMAQAKVPSENGEVLFTASFGVTAVSLDEECVEEVLPRVDSHLYQAKLMGRNRVVGTASSPNLNKAWVI
ncbi:MAG: hypothetical protein RLZZ09_506 [Pseudomonadota bacterium]